jgi:murein DD-endopeptidase MepM/ murein hydrolase activator NlpD
MTLACSEMLMGRSSSYYHIRERSASVKVGDHVKAGQVLAHLGNAGSSSEPHLHFGYLVYDHREPRPI